MKLSSLPSYQSKFFKVSDLEGKEQVFTISGCEVRDTKKYMSEELEKKAFLKFEENDKELQLTKTNVSILETAHGDIESFTGKKVVLYPSKTQSGQDTVGMRAKADETAPTSTESKEPTEEVRLEDIPF